MARRASFEVYGPSSRPSDPTRLRTSSLSAVNSCGQTGQTTHHDASASLLLSAGVHLASLSRRFALTPDRLMSSTMTSSGFPGEHRERAIAPEPGASTG